MNYIINMHDGETIFHPGSIYAGHDVTLMKIIVVEGWAQPERRMLKAEDIMSIIPTSLTEEEFNGNL